MATMEQMAELMKTVVTLTESITKQAEAAQAAAAAATVGGAGGGGGNKKLLDMKAMKLDNFTGLATDWEDWAFTFRRTLRAQSAMVFDALVTAEGQKTEISEDTYTVDQQKVSGELYDTLVQMCRG